MNNQLILFGGSEHPPFQWWANGTRLEGTLLFAVPGDPPPPERIRDVIAQKGGILIQTYRPDHKGVKLEVAVGKTSHFSPPTRALVVHMSGDSGWIEWKQEAVYIQPLETLLVPASKEIEDRLFRFHRSLESLPADHRTALLFTLVDPTLEARVASLEAFRAQMEERQTRPKGLVDAGVHWLRRRDAWLIAVVSLIVILGVLLYGYYGLRDGLNDSVGKLRPVLEDIQRMTKPPVLNAQPPAVGSQSPVRERMGGVEKTNNSATRKHDKKQDEKKQNDKNQEEKKQDEKKQDEKK